MSAGSYEIIKSDVLIIGGGLAGTFAAIKAADEGASVTLLDKAAIRRSGNGGHGMDHLPVVAHPALNVHPDDLAKRSLPGVEGLQDPKLAFIFAREGYDRVMDLRGFGLEVCEDDGTFHFQPGSLELNKGNHEARWTMIFFRGADLKMKLAAEVRRRGVRVVERTMGTSLLTRDDRVVGATGLNTRDGSFVVCQAKGTVIATGGAHRLYHHPEGIFANYYCPTNCGDGHALAYRAGARLTGMEFTQVQGHTVDYPPGPRPHGFYTKVVDSEGNDIIRQLGLPGNQLRAYAMAILQARREGKVLYYDTDRMSPEAVKMWQLGMANEHPAVLKFLAHQDVDLSKTRRECKVRYFGLQRSLSGLVIDETGATSLPGLYCAGDPANSAFINGATGAFILGARAGKYAALYSKSTDLPEIETAQAEDAQRRALGPLGRASAFKAIDLENRIRLLMSDYSGTEKGAERLNHGLQLLLKTRAELLPKVGAANPHEGMRAVEVDNIIDVAEMHLRASLFREESRLVPFHYRTDFPQQDDANWQKAVVIERDGEKMKLSAMSPEHWLRRD